MSNLLYLIAVFASGLKICCAYTDYCTINTYDIMDYGMQFTKELNHDDFAIAENFKEIHCCAKGYSSIEWYKDGQPYPWNLELSTFVIYPPSQNQTIFTQRIGHEDSGIYTCVLRDNHGNRDGSYSHETQLNVFDKAPDYPEVTFFPSNMMPRIGASLRLFCEAFGGTVNLSDAYEAVWYKELSNETLTLPERLHQEKTSRENGETFGAYLKFEMFQPEDESTYVCVINNSRISVKQKVIIGPKAFEIYEYEDENETDAVEFYIDPNPFPWKQITIAFLVVWTLLVSIIVLIKKYGPKVEALVKDKCCAIEDYDGKTNDVLIAYSPNDTELATGIMLPKLKARSYTCVSSKMTCDITNWPADIFQYAESSRRIIVILSPAALNDMWTSDHLYKVLKHFQTVNTCKTIYVTVTRFPVSGQVKTHIDESLLSLINQMNIIQWNASKDENFWFRLYKELPPKRSKYWVKGKTDLMLP